MQKLYRVDHGDCAARLNFADKTRLVSAAATPVAELHWARLQCQAGAPALGYTLSDHFEAQFAQQAA